MTEHPVESILQYRFSNRDLLNEALLAAGASASTKELYSDVQGNKRLALVGDSVLQVAILEPWYDSNESTGKCLRQKLVEETDLPEEGFNKEKTLCRNTKLNQVAQKSGLVTYVAKYPSQKGQVPQETAASTVEAVVGAVYLDCGKDIETVKRVLEAINFYGTT